MKTIRHNKRGRENVLHIETELGIVNITVGLHDVRGREVTSIEIIPDAGVERDGYANTRLIKVMDAECNRCGSWLDDDGLCTDETCPYSDHPQSWDYEASAS